MVSGLGLEDESLIPFDAGVDGRLLDGPLADVGEDLLWMCNGLARAAADWLATACC